MLIAHCHEIGSNYIVIELFDAWRGKWSGDEFSTAGVGGRKRLMGMHGSTVIFGITELISEKIVSMRSSWVGLFGRVSGAHTCFVATDASANLRI